MKLREAWTTEFLELVDKENKTFRYDFTIPVRRRMTGAIEEDFDMMLKYWLRKDLLKEFNVHMIACESYGRRKKLMQFSNSNYFDLPNNGTSCYGIVTVAKKDYLQKFRDEIQK